MPFDPARHHRRSIRLRGYDYSQAGAYFITVCVQNRECLFGTIRDGGVDWSPFGERVVAAWEALPSRFPNVDLDAWVVMPNHLHGIVVLLGSAADQRTTSVEATTQGGETPPLPTLQGNEDNSRRPALGQILAAFKYLSTKEMNRLRGTPGQRIWQRNYYEHIIRNDVALERLRTYTIENPLRWELDQLHPDQPSGW